jgi:hypothetical protein
MTTLTYDPTITCDDPRHEHDSLDDARSCVRRTMPHAFALYTYPDGSTREILDGRLGKNGKWYAYPVCNDCGARRTAKVHTA